MMPRPQGRSSLPAAPEHIVMDGVAQTGRYAGCIEQLQWHGLASAQRHSALWRRMHHKRWQYVGLGSDEIFVGVAIVDLGWGMTAFAYVFDRLRKRVIADWAQDGLPRLSGQVSDAPVREASAWFRGPGARLSLKHGTGETLLLDVRTPACRVHAELQWAQAAPFLLAVGPIDGGAAHATQKSSALPVQGWVDVGPQRWSLDKAVGSLDASNGLLAHDTSWRWACAHRADVGFNLQQGYFGGQENALWLDGELIPLGAAHFEFDAKQPLAPWHISTDDGLLDLQFQPEGARSDDRNFGIVASYYIQPVGTFHGRVRRSPGTPAVPVTNLLGVTEDHRSRW